MPKFLDCGGRSLQLDQTAIMGILNTTPDSFSDGGKFLSVNAAISHGCRLAEQGANIIDVGGESTRPSARLVSLQEELDRVLPVIEGLIQRIPQPVSIDSSKPEVMQQAVQVGAGMVNDVNALETPSAVNVLSQLKVPVCLMHRQGDSKTMQHQPCYRDVIAEIESFLIERIAKCLSQGLNENQIVIDPGFGFGKSVTDNYKLLANLHRFSQLGYPLLVGLSRKSMLGAVTQRHVEKRLAASIAAASLAAIAGASIVRVHDVKETADALAVVNATLQQQ